MTINEIMMRDLMEEERKQREREEAAEARQAKSGTDIVRAATIAGGVLAVATMLLLIWCIISDTPHRRGNNSQTTERECATAN